MSILIERIWPRGYKGIFKGLTTIFIMTFRYTLETFGGVVVFSFK
jgi:hypothetical protein